MTRIRRINQSQVEGGNSNNTDTSEIRPLGEMAVYVGANNKLELLMFDGVRTHLRSKVLSKGTFYGGDADSNDIGNGIENLDTIKLIPDAELHYNNGSFGNDQYVIIDPTLPNHIHIRAGGAIDQSNAYLFLGGELTNVVVSDDAAIVKINTFTGVGTGTNNWTFGQDGTTTLPQGGVISEVTVNNEYGILLTPSPISGTNPDMAVKIYPTFNDDDHIHITAGNPGTVDLFLGDDIQYVKLEQDGGNVVISVDHPVGIKWTFDVNGRLTLPKNSSVREVTPATGAAANVIVIQSASSILNTSFATLPPAPISNYAVPGTGIVVNVTWSTNGEDYHAPAFVVVNGGSGHTGGGESGGGDVLTVPFVDMGITGGGNWTWYVADIASDVVLAAGLESWRFAADGTTTLPGAVIKSTVAKTGVILPTTTGTAETLSVSPAISELTDGTYGPFTLGVATFSILVVGGIINGITNLTSTGDVTVGDNLGTIDSGDIGGIPGATPLTITVSNVVQATPTALDLTKSVNKLTEGSYTLANGVEGQIMYIVRQNGSTAANIFVEVASARWDGGVYPDQPVIPFQIPFTDMVTIIFTDGAWQSSTFGSLT